MARTKKQSTEAAVREIRRRTRRKFAPEEKVRIDLEPTRSKAQRPEIEGFRGLTRLRDAPRCAWLNKSHHKSHHRDRAVWDCRPQQAGTIPTLRIEGENNDRVFVLF